MSTFNWFHSIFKMASLFTAAFFFSTGYLRWKLIVRDLFFEYTGTTEEKHTEI
jgi:hypothetical protein